MMPICRSYFSYCTTSCWNQRSRSSKQSSQKHP